MVNMESAQKMILPLESIRKLLGTVVLKEVAARCGLHYDTVRQIASGMQTNPTYSVLRALSRYFQERA